MDIATSAARGLSWGAFWKLVTTSSRCQKLFICQKLSLVSYRSCQAKGSIGFSAPKCFSGHSMCDAQSH